VREVVLLLLVLDQKIEKSLHTVQKSRSHVDGDARERGRAQQILKLPRRIPSKRLMGILESTHGHRNKPLESSRC